LKNVKHIDNRILVCTPCQTLDCATVNDTNQSRFPAFFIEALPTIPGGTSHDYRPKVIQAQLKDVDMPLRTESAQIKDFVQLTHQARFQVS